MFRNFTPHVVKIIDSNGNVAMEIPPEGVQVRVKEQVEYEGIIQFKHEGFFRGVPVVRKKYAEIEGLPQQEDGVTLIVSVIVLNASDRSDLVCPDTGPDSVVRDEDGNILGVRRFQKK
jgi:hypothetical protein